MIFSKDSLVIKNSNGVITLNQNNYNNKNDKSKLIMGIHLIDTFIGAIITLICVVIYMSIEDPDIKIGAIVFCVILGIICIILTYKSLEKQEIIVKESNISKVELVNEENEIIREWDLIGQVSVIIGKSTKDEKVFIDLNNSIYSPVIDNHHALLNYANGKWYVEDISQNEGIVIQKPDETEKYRIVKGSPCTVRKGDVIFISKVKLLLS